MKNKKSDRFIPPNGWNDEFNKVFDFIVNGEGNGCIEAVAGGGKTTALVESIIRYLEKNPKHKVLFVAFNVSVKDEGIKRLKGYNCDVLTCHGLGYKSVRKPSSWGGPSGKQQFEIQNAYGPYMEELVKQQLGDEDDKREDREALLKLINLAKSRLANDVHDLIQIMNDYSIYHSYDNWDFCKYAIKILEFTSKRPGISKRVKSSFGKRRNQSKAIISFDDQIWLPIINDWEVDQYDAVFVDECQDLSLSRRTLIKKSLKKNSRLFICGDRNQAIYSFSGADIDSLQQMVQEFDCKILSLSCSWRCDKAIIEEAKKINKKITFSLNADEGKVDTCYENELLDIIKPNEIIISRYNAPLVKLFFKLAKQQKKVKFIGRDYGETLSRRIRNWKNKHENEVFKGNAVGDFTGRMMLECNEEWLQYMKDNNNGKIKSRFKDEFETINYLVNDLDNLDSKKSVLTAINRCNLFTTKDINNDSDCIILSSTHKFKGLEKDHVFLIKKTYDCDLNQEEANLLYVAQTRAKKHLTYVLKND